MIYNASAKKNSLKVVEAKKCATCDATNIVKNGCNGVDNPKYKCKNCGFGMVFQTHPKSEEVREQLIKASKERSSSRGLGRIFGVSHQTP